MTTSKVDQVGMLVRNDDGSVAWAPWDRLPAEAMCPKCGESIRWALDMFSFTTGFDKEHPFTLAHARCAWRVHAFDREAVKTRAKEIGGFIEIGVDAAAYILDVPESAVQGYIQQGKLAARTLARSGALRVPMADVIALVDDDAM